MEILQGSDIHTHVLSLIEQSQKFAMLVSAYFSPWDRLSIELKRAAMRKVQVHLLVRGGEERAKHERLTAEFESVGVRTHFLDRLHAKVYANESQVIITSFNLLKSSAMDSWELGIRLDRSTEPTAYEQALRAAVTLFQRSREAANIEAASQRSNDTATLAAALATIQAGGGNPTTMAQVVQVLANAVGSAPPRTSTGSGKRKSQSTRTRKPKSGTCIRCAESIAYDPLKPLCNSCYKSWAKWSNPDYPEEYCHGCGEPESTTSNKPLCRSCWRSA